MIYNIFLQFSLSIIYNKIKGRKYMFGLKAKQEIKNYVKTNEK